MDKQDYKTIISYKDLEVRIAREADEKVIDLLCLL